MKYTFVKSPVVHLIADTQYVHTQGLEYDLFRRGADVGDNHLIEQILPHSWNAEYKSAERICEFAGKLCYNAFGKNGSTKSTKDYLNDSVYKAGHLSIAYHAHFSLYISGISRRLSHELLRHYIGVGASEGSPSQMSTRYVVHPARFVVHPRYLQKANLDGYSLPLYHIENEYTDFKRACRSGYRNYRKLVASADSLKGLAKKRVLEAAASALPQAVETSLILTMNPISARKMILERTGETADLEFHRLATKIQSVLEDRYKAFSFR